MGSHPHQAVHSGKASSNISTLSSRSPSVSSISSPFVKGKNIFPLDTRLLLKAVRLQHPYPGYVCPAKKIEQAVSLNPPCGELALFLVVALWHDFGLCHLIPTVQAWFGDSKNEELFPLVRMDKTPLVCLPP